ncbi:phospholipase D-like domain-containing protein [Paenibacillus sp. CAU 1782]
MERILHSSDIKHNLEQELSRTNHDIVIISAFVKFEALKFINNFIPKNVATKTLLVRFRLEDIISGSTDMEIFDFCRSNNWRMYINFDLHSKIIVFDRQRVIIGSANVTSNGLGLGGSQNIESIARIQATEEEMNKINKLIRSSKELDENMFEIMKADLSLLNVQLSLPKFYWSESVQEKFQTDVDYLWTADLLFSHSPQDICKHDLEILELSEAYSLSDVRRQFIRSKPYRWLREAVKDEIYFGQLTAKLHDSLMDDPKPYRRNVKILLSDLLNWLKELNIEDIVVDRPNHSQRIRVIS